MTVDDTLDGTPPHPPEVATTARTRPRFLDQVGGHLATAFLVGLGTLLVVLAAIIGAPADTTSATTFLLVAIGVLVHVSYGTVLGGLAQRRGLRNLGKAVREELSYLAIGTIVLLLLLGALYWYVAIVYSTIVWWLVGIAAVSTAAGFGFEWMAASADPSTRAARLRGRRQSVVDQFESTAVLLGVVAGLIVAVVALAASAIVDTAAQQTAPNLVTLPQTAPFITFGNYVALGDSYSAGQGLDPTGDCSQSAQAYGRLLAAAEKWPHVDFEACSGAVIGDIFGKVFFGPQVKATAPQPDVGLVTLTIGGNDALFSDVVTTCIQHPSCMWGNFPPSNVTEQEPVNGGKPEPLAHQWAQQTMVKIEGSLDGLFSRLTTHFPNARVVVVGYPYLFPDGPAPLAPDLMCATVLRRADEPDRAEIRYLQDEFNDVIYEETLRWGVDFVTPQALWAGHEPCGQHGQWTNAIELFLSPNPLGKGSFHPTSAGQRALAALVSCYLSRHPNHPPKQQLAIPSGAPVPHTALTFSGGAPVPAAWGTSSNDFAGCGFK
jgi:hypothetical protein